MDRQAAWDLLCEYTAGDGLRKHGLAVEAVMRHFARKHGEDEDAWAIVGLLHDFDYERWPDEHPMRGADVLRAHGLPEASVTAVLGHAGFTGVPRDTLMAKVLFAVDELTGFITAVALVRPNKSLAEVEPAAVRKKMKDKAFARSVNRDDIVNGAQQLGVDLDAHIAEVIAAMRLVAPQLGLAGA